MPKGAVPSRDTVLAQRGAGRKGQEVLPLMQSVLPLGCLSFGEPDRLSHFMSALSENVMHERFFALHRLVAFCFCLFLLAVLQVQAATLPQPGPLNAAQSLALISGFEEDRQKEALAGASESLVILDVRSRAEYEAGHIPGAQLVPLDELERRMDEVPSVPVLIVCRTGIRASYAWQMLTRKRPEQTFWYVRAVPRYSADGGWTIVDR